MSELHRGARALLVTARSSITAAADKELETLCERLRQRQPDARVLYAYTEQGTPALRTVLHQMADEGIAEIVLLPLLLPMEPGLTLSLQRVINRWRREGDGGGGGSNSAWPVVRIAPAPASVAAIDSLLDEMARQGQAATPADGARVPEAEGATVPAQRYRVLVCAGGPCTDAGAAVVWGHLRNIQKARCLRTDGPGVMTCKTSCLGPCGLAPVMQVWPDGTWYGGVDEAGVERIVEQHLLGGEAVTELSYVVQPGKQRLRSVLAARQNKAAT
jgi:(2Fe-2S) ferredoxin